MAEKVVILSDAVLEMKSMIETKETIWTTYTWTITNFTKLENYVYYNRYGSFTKCDWYLRLIKSDSLLSFIFQSDFADGFVNFTIVGEGNQVLNGGLSKDVSDGVFTVNFKMDAILDPKNGYLMNDSLVVQCKYLATKSSENKMNVIPWDEHRERLDLFEIQKEWRQMYLQSRFCDFKIIAQGNVFYTHKVILIARSKFFAEHFANKAHNTENEFMLSVSPCILHEVLMFMYTGELVNMNVSMVLIVLELAIDLGIKSLMQKCYDSLREQMDDDNVVCICLKAQDLKLKCLLQVCEQYMQLYCPENLQLVQISQENN